MEEKIKILQDTLNFTEAEAQAALNLAEGDLDKALQMREYVAQSFLIIRARYKTRNSDYGVFNLLADSNKGEFLEINSVAGQISELESLDLDVSDEIFIKTIERIKNNQRHAKSKDYELKKMFYPTEIFKLVELVKKDKEDEAERVLQEKIGDELEEEVVLKAYFKLLTKVQLRSLRPDLNLVMDKESEDDQTEEEEIEESDSEKKKLRVKLKAIPIISPTKGKRVGELKQGDRILIKINDNSELGRYFKKILEKKEGMTVAEIAIIEYNKDSQRYFIQIEIGPQIFSNIYLEPEIKLAVSKVSQQEFIDSDLNQFKFTEIFEAFGPYIAILPLIIIIIILLLVILFI